MPHKKSAMCLKNLCWEVVKVNIHDHGFRTEFQSLPNKLMNEILERLSDELFPSSKHGNYQRPTKLPIIKLLENVLPICRDLRKLKMKYCPLSVDRYSSGYVFKRIILHHPHIRHLDLTCSSCADDDLEVIGTNCSRLRLLNLYGCGKITNKGMKFLCTQTTGEARNLKITKLNLLGTFITASGCLIALKNLLVIRNLKYADWVGVFWLLLEEVQSGKSLPCYPIENLLIYCNTKEEVHRGMTMLNSFPNLRKLSFQSRFMENGTIPDLLEMTTVHLTNLSAIIGVNDIEIIERHCPLLRKLRIAIVHENVVDENDEEMPVTETSFKHLRKLVLDYEGKPQFRVRHYKMLLANCHRLECLCVLHNRSFDDAVMFEVLRWNPLRNLRKIRLESYQLTAAPLRKLVEMDNPLSYIDVKFCENVKLRDIREIVSKIEELNLDLVINHK